jgi:hypothetical protein
LSLKSETEKKKDAFDELGWDPNVFEEFEKDFQEVRQFIVLQFV